MGGFSSKPPQLDESKYVKSPTEEQENNMLANATQWHLYSESLEPLKVKLNPSKSPYTVGRSSSNDVVICCSLASKKHLELVWKEDTKRWHCKDLQSSGGTKIHYGGKYKKYQNTDESLEIPLQSCCGIQVGKEILTLKCDNLDPTMVLECIEGPMKDTTYPISNRRFSVGRNGGNTLVLAKSEVVSGIHFEIKRRVGWFALADLNSRNGTLVSNVKLTEDAMYFLWPGAKIKIGFKVKNADMEPDPSTFIARMKYME